MLAKNPIIINKVMQIQSKTDNTPLTEVDIMSHEIIVHGLKELAVRALEACGSALENLRGGSDDFTSSTSASSSEEN